MKQVEVGTTTTNVQVPTVEMKSKQVEVPTVRVGDGNQQKYGIRPVGARPRR